MMIQKIKSLQQALIKALAEATVKRERKRLDRLLDQGVSYTAPALLAALARLELAGSDYKRVNGEA